ncbi:hydantoinase/oxoprolinase N-terminal domain-containing protein [Kribbella shirazensis]|uniref:N-methylhydantoinase A/oxoprolinase/acetone carboxylase beta subunit n=1 Tax=Kribbella shirazensis TaxID=1105143 RepID=A0A7X6A4H1_9ACTN|nr:hydantoinase/oxoprolinase family protein [Kribbella shirazensis]NIK61502.1 N-methylhydantoinase A/oxoprolinase/acetone carboxylase beta subunit [Kribbella shirazensis]
MSYRIGIDVGGTNTDAVVLDGREVLAATKTPTTEDVTIGILAALTDVLRDVDTADVSSVFIGTTHFINAIAQARGLEQVAVVRLATPPQSMLPMLDWPDHLKPVVGDRFYVCAGGAQFDGRSLGELDEVGLRAIAKQIAESGVRHIALSSVFSTVNPEPELAAERLLLDELPDVTVTRSGLVGRVGLLERENATILNAALLGLAGRVIDGLEQVVAQAGIHAPVLLSQNDGTVMTLDRARSFPIFTIASGPTNSMRGAALLTGIDDAVVVDVGGTTTDVGLLQNGFPRESTVAMSLAGVRSNFRIPDVLSMALGGGTLVSADGGTVGPESVGYRITSQARLFGGDTLTFSDVAVAAGAAPMGDPGRVADLDPTAVRRALEVAADRVAQAVEKAKLQASATPVIVVGGGAPLLAVAPGLTDLVIPEQAGVANAVGAAFAEAGGEVDRVYNLLGSSRAEALAEAKAEAIARAVEAGADLGQVRVVDADDVPLTHLGGGSAVHIRVKAAGPFPTSNSETPERN